MEHPFLAGIIDAVQGKVEPFLVPPNGPGSYFRMGAHLLSKRMCLLLLAGALGVGVLFAGSIYPWMDGRLWASRLILGSEKASGFTGRAVLFTAGGVCIYEGALANGLPTGIGTQYGRDGQLVYRGAFQSGQYGGEGRLYGSGALRYAGGFLENRFSGEGAQYDAKGRLLYQGGFAEGLWAGSGTEFAPETGRKRYTGGFAAGLREGQGTEYGPDGETALYRGGFAQGAYSGRGRLYQDGGLWYEGSFVEGELSGPGTRYDPVTGGVLYEGAFLAGLYDGEGRLYDAGTGRLAYSGSFSAGLRCGEGTEYDELGRALFSGRFRDGMIDLMCYLGTEVADVQSAFGVESARKTVGGTQVLIYAGQELAVVCRPSGEGARCWKIVSGLPVALAGVRRGASRAEVRAALGEPFTALDLELGTYYGAVFTGLGIPLAGGAPVPGEKYLRGGYFIRVYYSPEGKAAAVELCAMGGN